jgi:acetolactate synthase-1/2/3 large subunit
MRWAFREIDQLAVFKPITKWATRIYDAKRIPELVATAYRQATTGKPGPVYIDMPGDVLGESVDESTITYPKPWAPAPRTHGDPAAITEAIALLAKAERPLILGGSGVWWSDAAAAFQAFVEATGIPFYTTPISRGTVPEDHELAFLNARAKAFSEVDVLLAVGTRFNFVIQFGRPPRFAADAKVIPSTSARPSSITVARPTCDRRRRAPCSGRLTGKRAARSTEPLLALGLEAEGPGHRGRPRNGQTDELRRTPDPSAASLQGGPRLREARRDPWWSTAGI